MSLDELELSRDDMIEIHEEHGHDCDCTDCEYVVFQGWCSHCEHELKQERAYFKPPIGGGPL